MTNEQTSQALWIIQRLHAGFDDFVINKDITEYIRDMLHKNISPKVIEFNIMISHISENKGPNPIETNEYIYMIKTESGTKIGRTKSPNKRVHNISTKLPFNIIKSEYFIVENMVSEELKLHKKYKEYRLNGEWFDLSDKQYSEIKDTLKPLFERKEIV